MELLAAFKASKSIYDFLLELRNKKHQNRRDIFEKILDPLFHEFLSVQDDYSNLFTSAKSSLTQGSLAGSKSDDTTSTIVSKVKSDFLDARQHNEHMRDKVRVGAQDFLSAVKYPEEKRFLLSLIFYYLEDPTPQYREDILDLKIQLIIDQGGLHTLDTPSMRVASAVQKTDNPNELEKVFENARSDLNRRSSNVCTHYRRLQLAVLN